MWDLQQGAAEPGEIPSGICGLNLKLVSVYRSSADRSQFRDPGSERPLIKLRSRMGIGFIFLYDLLGSDLEGVIAAIDQDQGDPDPDLFSPLSVTHEKFRCYRQLPSLQDYLRVAPDRISLERYQRPGQREWILLASPYAFLDIRSQPQHVGELT